jgi:hypothetical protein
VRTTTASAGTNLGDDLIGQLWQPAFPSPDLLALAAQLLPEAHEATGPTVPQVEGPRWEIIIAPGAIQVRTTDWAKKSRYQEREAQRQRQRVDLLAGWLSERDGVPINASPAREIIGWSRKSRANMVKTLCQLDYSPLFADSTRLPAMLTLTYPGDWLTVAPNGRAVKKHLKAFRKRYRRAWGESLMCVWKLEFQHRGAPHFHLLMVPPHGRSADGLAFREWVSLHWAQVVDHPDAEEYRKHLAAGTGLDWDNGLRSRDPKRVAVYFTKHGSFKAKEYQNCVPEAWQQPGQGPGRFWGYWGLRPARVGIKVLPSDGIKAGRILRRWSRAQRTTRQATVKRVQGGTATSAYTDVIGLAGAEVLSRKVRYRTSRVRVRRLPGNRGWVSVNDGAAFASQLARWLTLDAATPA